MDLTNSMSLKAAIFDMDGVVTDTAELHFQSWKLLFDDYLDTLKKEKATQAAEKNIKKFQPFTMDDYLEYVDGMVRYNGVSSFLTSRHIQIPLGHPDDSPDQETFCGLANKKNILFLELLEKGTIDLFEGTVSLIKKMRDHNIKTAIVSSSKNCQLILQKSGIEGLFDTRIDGSMLSDLGLQGKPHPDMFLAAAQQLNTDPHEAVIVEDAISGVQAGKAGQFKLIIGLSRQDSNAHPLKLGGANIVVNDLAELTLEDIKNWFIPLPSALNQFNAIAKQLKDKKPAVFLDYDGTLTPIVDRPELAVLNDNDRKTLHTLAEHYPTAIISGRELKEIQSLINIDTLYYAGNHGFEIEGPDHHLIEYQQGEDTLAEIKNAVTKLQRQLSDIPGVLVQDKKFTLSVHYRLCAKESIPTIEAIIDQIIKEEPKLRKHKGKKVFEIRPAIDWHKGKALLWLLKTINPLHENLMPIYIGDDLTDEDAFLALRNSGCGLGILVSENQSATSQAHYRLNNTSEVYRFLEQLINYNNEND